MLAVVNAGEGVAVGVPRGFGSGVVRRRCTWVPVGVLRPVGGRAGGLSGLSWTSWPGGCRGRVISPVSAPWQGAGVPAMRLSEACLEAPDVGAWVHGVHQFGGGFTGGGQLGLPKRCPALRGPQLCGAGGGVPGRGMR